MNNFRLPILHHPLGFSMIEVMIALLILTVTLLSSISLQRWAQQRSQLLVEREKLQWLVRGIKTIMLNHSALFMASDCVPNTLTYQSFNAFCSQDPVNTAFPSVCKSHPPKLLELEIGACCPTTHAGPTLCWLGLRWWHPEGGQQAWLHSTVLP